MTRWLWVALACCGVASPANAQDGAEDTPIVVVALEDPEDAFGRWRGQAQGLVSGLFRDAGVTLVWRVDELANAGRQLAVRVTSATAWSGTGAETMGVSPSPGDGTRGTQAYVFGDRIKAFAERYAVPVAYVLACAVAHELGHLLLPSNAHDGGGIMRGTWQPRLFPPKSPGIQGFTQAHARLLRLRLRPGVQQ